MAAPLEPPVDYPMTPPTADSAATATNTTSRRRRQTRHKHVQRFYDDNVRRYDLCIRCQRQIYPTEKADVGICLHKNCFRCAECNVTLTLNSYIVAKPETADRKGVYCKTHAPKPIRYAMDDQSMDIVNAVKAQQMNKQHGFNKLVRVSGEAGWEYDAKAMEFEHAKALHKQKKKRPETPITRPRDFNIEEEGCGERILDRLKQGGLDRENVKELAVSFSQQRVSTTADLGLSAHAEVDETEDDTRFYWPTTTPPPPSPPPPPPQQQATTATAYKPAVSDQLTRRRSSVEDEAIYESLSVIRRSVESSETSPPPPPLPPTPRPVFKLECPPKLPARSADTVFDKARLAEVLYELYRAEALLTPDIASKDCIEAPTYENLPAAAAVTSATAAPGLSPRRPSTSHSHKLPFKEKMLVQQNELELRQRHEHGEMFRDFERSREEQMTGLEMELRAQMEKAVNDLVYKMDQGLLAGDLRMEKLRIEQHFQQMKEEKMRTLLDKLNLQERMRIDKMIDKQTCEMLQLIDMKAPAQLPPPAPPRCKKDQLYEGPHVFDEVDFNAVQAAQRNHGSFTELVHELTSNCRSQLEKARALFRWITVKDLNTMIFSEVLTEENPYYFLKGIKYGLESYHELFKRLASYAGLMVRIIRGYSKSVGYKTCMPFTSDRFRNAWAVVHIDGDWRFIDTHWGARHVSTNQEKDSMFYYELDEFFFLTDPDHLIYMHFPDEAEWQLLPSTLTLHHFVDLPVVKSHFFLYGLSFPQECVHARQALLETHTGMLELILERDEKVPLAFNTRLEAEEEVLDGYCIHHTRDKQVIFSLNLPKKGTFHLTIFACDTDKADSYNNVCSFKLKCHHVEVKPFCKFPRLPHGYGPTPLAKELGMSTEKYKEHYLVCNENRVILNIRFSKAVKISHRLMCHELGDNNDQLDRLVFLRYRDHSFVSYLIRFPQRAVYLFSIFAGLKESGNPLLECACRYLIQCNASNIGQGKCTARAYPKTQPHWVKCRLHEPTTGDLVVNKNVKFKLEVHAAADVTVIVGTQWFYLKKDASKETLWEGIAFTGQDATVTADVYARYGKCKDFYPLLEYRLVEED